MSALDGLGLGDFDQQTDILQQKSLSTVAALEHVRFRQVLLYPFLVFQLS